MLQGIYKRFGLYTIVGVSTFLLDLFLVFVLTSNGLGEYEAIVVSFILAVSINFIFAYKYVFKGTQRKIQKGYLYFMCIALAGIVIIGPSTVFLSSQLGLNLYVARVIVGGTTGVVNFLLNNFYNFRMGLE